ncbi:hypothetical protein Tco_0864947 [Tanacetum coccineum]
MRYRYGSPDIDMEVLNLFLKQEIKDNGGFVYHPGSLKIVNVWLKEVKQKVDDWKNKSLSYAGRWQLIVSVLSVMHLYWAQVFLLPRDTIYETEKAMKGFLWSQGELAKGKAKISWKNVCCSKSQGGLGIKPLREWNEVLLLKNLWNVAANKQLLWAIWIDKMKLKGRSLWKVSPDSNSSWGWRHLLSLRDKIIPHIFHCMGNGLNTSVWHDTWVGCDPLDKQKRNSHLYQRLDNDTKVADMFDDEVWLASSDWDDILRYLEGFQGVNKICNILRSLAIAATVYHIWRERNHRLFQNIDRDSQCVRDAIIKDMEIYAVKGCLDMLFVDRVGKVEGWYLACLSSLLLFGFDEISISESICTEEVWPGVGTVGLLFYLLD